MLGFDRAYPGEKPKEDTIGADKYVFEKKK